MHSRFTSRRLLGAGWLLMLLGLVLWAGSAQAVAEAEPGDEMEAYAEEDATLAVEAEETIADEAVATPPEQVGSVARSVFTSAIEDREPVDEVRALENDATRIFYFTELVGMEGQTVTHRWEHDGQVMAEVPFDVRGARWRVYSSKTLDPSWLGAWRAAVVDAAGRVLASDEFEYVRAVPAATGAAPEPEPEPEL